MPISPLVTIFGGEVPKNATEYYANNSVLSVESTKLMTIIEDVVNSTTKYISGVMFDRREDVSPTT